MVMSKKLDGYKINWAACIFINIMLRTCNAIHFQVDRPLLHLFLKRSGMGGVCGGVVFEMD